MPAIPVDSVEDLVRRRGGDLVELSHAIHAEPELAFAEHRSCAKTQALVAERGFEVTAPAGGRGDLEAAFGDQCLRLGAAAMLGEGQLRLAVDVMRQLDKVGTTPPHDIFDAV